MTRVVLLSGGVGGSRFALGMRAALERIEARGGATRLSVIANTGDDAWMAGLRVQPDLDSLLYALSGVSDTERGWGRAGDTERVSAELREWGVGEPWFTLGDLDLAAHVARTLWKREGRSGRDIAQRLAGRWPVGVDLLPMTDHEVDTRVTVDGEDGTAVELHFQEWWTRHRATLRPRRFRNPGIIDAIPGEGVLDALAAADVAVIAPSNPVVSIGPILDVPGIRDAVRAIRGNVVGVSPVIAGSVVRGMADVCLEAIGVRTSADAVAAHYGARGAGGMLDGWVLSEEDAALAPVVASAGITPTVAPLWMTDLQRSTAMAEATLRAAGVSLGR